MMFERGAPERHELSATSAGRPASDERIRMTLRAIVAASIDGSLPADGGFARTGLRREVATYAAAFRAAGRVPEQLLVALKTLVDEPTAQLEQVDRRRLSDEVVAWAIEAYYGTYDAKADVVSR